MSGSTYRWDAPELAFAGDSAWVRPRRALQSWYREHVLEVGPGRIGGRPTPVGNRIDPSALGTRPGLNFLHRAAYLYASRQTNGPGPASSGPSQPRRAISARTAAVHSRWWTSCQSGSCRGWLRAKVSYAGPSPSVWAMCSE